MLKMNRVMLVGNLTRDPVLRKTPAGVACADMSIAVNESYSGKDGKTQESVCFVEVVAWDKQAQACGEYLQKGVPVFVEGRLQYEEWEDKEGHKRNKIKVRADRVQFMGRPGGGSGGEGAARVRRDEPMGRNDRIERSRRMPEEAMAR